MASKKTRTKKRRPKTIRPLDAEVFELAEKVALIFDRPEAAPLRARLVEEAGAYRNRLRPYGLEDLWATTTKWTAFLLQMILTCPRLLSRPPDFEWVLDDLEWLLTRRRLDPGFDRDFWAAVSRVKKGLRTGHPRNRALDSLRFTLVHDLMHAPEQLVNMVQTFSKSEAVERAAEMEGKLLGTRPPHERVVYRSLARIEKENEALVALLRPPTSLDSPPANTLDNKPKARPKNTEKRRTQAKHQTRGKPK
ncbi:MAG: hypothetical protein BVN28_06665 [Nitrospira sp. ST-bin4]|nr:MAG: hypothetical protein BVN28_06665 [Nitrospira sp. ST-bin4]